MSIYVKQSSGISLISDKLNSETLATNVVAWTLGSLKGFKVAQSTSTQITSVADIYKLKIDSKYYPTLGPVLESCTMYNTGDNHHYNGFVRFSEKCVISICALTTQGGLIDISSGSTWYIWSLNMMYV